MTAASVELPPRCAVVDLGSNSVRLVVYEGHLRNPMVVFNEKAVLRLGLGLQSSGLLNTEGMAQAHTVLRRYWTIACAMGADGMERCSPPRQCGTRGMARTSSGPLSGRSLGWRCGSCRAARRPRFPLRACCAGSPSGWADRGYRRRVAG